MGWHLLINVEFYCWLNQLNCLLSVFLSLCDKLKARGYPSAASHNCFLSVFGEVESIT